MPTICRGRNQAHCIGTCGHWATNSRQLYVVSQPWIFILHRRVERERNAFVRNRTQAQCIETCRHWATNSRQLYVVSQPWIFILHRRVEREREMCSSGIELKHSVLRHADTELQIPDKSWSLLLPTSGVHCLWQPPTGSHTFSYCTWVEGAIRKWPARLTPSKIYTTSAPDPNKCPLYRWPSYNTSIIGGSTKVNA